MAEFLFMVVKLSSVLNVGGCAQHLDRTVLSTMLSRPNLRNLSFSLTC